MNKNHHNSSDIIIKKQLSKIQVFIPSTKSFFSTNDKKFIDYVEKSIAKEKLHLWVGKWKYDILKTAKQDAKFLEQS